MYNYLEDVELENEFNIDINSEINQKIESINEALVASYYKNSGLSVFVYADDSRNYGGNIAYFKCAESTTYTSSTPVARISFIEPIYIIHNKDAKKSMFKLDRTQKKQLLELLNRNNTNKDGSVTTVWISLIREFNRWLALSSKRINSKTIDLLDENIPIPNYMELR